MTTTSDQSSDALLDGLDEALATGQDEQAEQAEQDEATGQDEQAPADPPLTVTLSSYNLGDAVPVVLDHDGPYYLTPPYVPAPVLCFPLVRMDADPALAAVLLDPEQHKALGARWRAWQEGDEPTAETRAFMARHTDKAKRARRCCGK